MRVFFWLPWPRLGAFRGQRKGLFDRDVLVIQARRLLSLALVARFRVADKYTEYDNHANPHLMV
jgi:hypothetical protein